MLNLKYKLAENGNCRVYYTANGNYYCWQLTNNRGDFELLTCSRNGEPECPVRLDYPVMTELPKGDERIERDLRAFLALKG